MATVDDLGGNVIKVRGVTPGSEFDSTSFVYTGIIPQVSIVSTVDTCEYSVGVREFQAGQTSGSGLE